MLSEQALSEKIKTELSSKLETDTSLQTVSNNYQTALLSYHQHASPMAQELLIIAAFLAMRSLLSLYQQAAFNPKHKMPEANQTLVLIDVFNQCIATRADIQSAKMAYMLSDIVGELVGETDALSKRVTQANNAINKTVKKAIKSTVPQAQGLRQSLRLSILQHDSEQRRKERSGHAMLMLSNFANVLEQNVQHASKIDNRLIKKESRKVSDIPSIPIYRQLSMNSEWLDLMIHILENAIRQFRRKTWVSGRVENVKPILFTWFTNPKSLPTQKVASQQITRRLSA